MSHKIVFQVHTWWRAGTGRGDGAALDDVAQLTPGGLPVLPGRTVKGLLRSAAGLAVQAGRLDSRSVERWFGSPLAATGSENAPSGDQDSVALEAARHGSTPGCLRFGSARVGDLDRQDAWESWAAAHPLQRTLLLDVVASTAMDANGVAMDQSLRVQQVAIPMTLTATLEGLEPQDAALFQAILPLIRSLGSDRRRGLGRVSVTLEER